MILIIGGSCQGKAEYARRLMKQRADAGSDADSGDNEKIGTDAVVRDGMKDGWQQAYGCLCLMNFHGFLRQVMEAGSDPDAFTKEVLDCGPEIITMDEVGCGIVPVERSERDYREAVGRAGQQIAKEADEVYRMMCGIPVRIK